MTGEYVIYDETADFSLAAEDPAPADPQLEHDMTLIALTRQARTGGASWADIGRTQGKPPKIARRDHKRLYARTRRQWHLQNNQEASE